MNPEYLVDLLEDNDFQIKLDNYILKATGFLRELSDATSIVVNPYNDVMGD